MKYIENKTDGNRIFFLDNLRTFMIFLVVLLHSGLVYESSGFGALFWIVDDYATNGLVDFLNMIMDIFVMSVIFFVSGFFAPMSLSSKTSLAFLRAKFRRLLVPWLVAVLTLIPMYKFMFLYSRNIPQDTWTSYFHWNNGLFSQNWLWFLPVLFLFDILYVLLRKTPLDLSRIDLKKAILAVFIIGYIYSVSMAIFDGMGWTKTFLIDFQNERFLIYLMIYLLGSICFAQKVFEPKPRGKKLYFAVCSTVWIPVAVYIFLTIHAFTNPGNFIVSEHADRLLLWLGFHLSLLCLLYILVTAFRFYLDKQGSIGSELSKNSYGVYIVHTIVLGVIAVPMLGIAIPSLLKFVILTVSTYITSNVIVSFYRKFIKSKVQSSIKNVKEGTMKTAAITILISVVFTAFSCGSQGDPASDNVETTSSQTAVKPPGISLHIAALQGNIDAVNQHIRAESDLDEKDQYGSTPLIIAITFDKTEVAKALIASGANVMIANNDGSTPLHIAAFLCRTEIVQELLKKGADKNIKNNAGSIPLESVSGPFDEVKPYYDGLGKALKPLGFSLDYERIKKVRPQIAEILR